MFIIWTGWGFLVFIIPLIILVLVQLAADGLSGDPSFYKNALWLQLIGIFISAVAVWYVGVYFNSKPGRKLIDKETGQDVDLKPSHTFFFIKMQYWAIAIMVIGLVSTFVK